MTEERAPASEGRSASERLQRVFIVGCPRSGTTWVQLLLAQHPAVATSQETHLFSRYLAPLERGWKFEHDASLDRKRDTGLASLLSDEEFYSLIREFADRIFQRIADESARARVVVEKTPPHVRHGDLILKTFPDAYLLHVIRDPRSVVSSMLSASGSWALHWAPDSSIEAAKTWRSDVTAGRRLAEETDRYREVRYEALIDDGPGELAKLYRWLGLPEDRSLCERAVEACAIDRLKKDSDGIETPWKLESEPEQFFRKGKTDSWRQELSEADLRSVEFLAGPLMEELGYRAERETSRRRPFRLLLREGLSWRLDRAYRWFRGRLDRL